jgi:hypothetical protein
VRNRSSRSDLSGRAVLAQMGDHLVTVEITPARPPRRPLRGVEVSETLFGLQIVAHGPGTRSVTVGLTERDGVLAGAITALLAGAGEVGC